MYKRILLPLGLSEFKSATLNPLLKQLADPKAQVTLLHVIEPISDADDEEVTAFLLRLKERAETFLQEVKKELESECEVLDFKVVTGKRSSKIVEFAKQEQVDLILMNAKRSVSDPVTPQQLANLGNLVAIMAPCSVFLAKDNE